MYAREHRLPFEIEDTSQQRRSFVHAARGRDLPHQPLFPAEQILEQHGVSRHDLCYFPDAEPSRGLRQKKQPLFDGQAMSVRFDIVLHEGFSVDLDAKEQPGAKELLRRFWIVKIIRRARESIGKLTACKGKQLGNQRLLNPVIVRYARWEDRGSGATCGAFCTARCLLILR